MTLTQANINQSVVLKEINIDSPLVNHLRDMGFIRGKEVTIISKNGLGMIVSILDGPSLAMAYEITDKVQI